MGDIRRPYSKQTTHNQGNKVIIYEFRSVGDTRRPYSKQTTQGNKGNQGNKVIIYVFVINIS